jgi:hypothetical protein
MCRGEWLDVRKISQGGSIEYIKEKCINKGGIYLNG